MTILSTSGFRASEIEDTGPDSLAHSRRAFHRRLLAEVLSVDVDGHPGNADKKSQVSCDISTRFVAQIGEPSIAQGVSYREKETQFAACCKDYLSESVSCFGRLGGGRWKVDCARVGVKQFEELRHLAMLIELCETVTKVADDVSEMNVVLPDIVISRNPEEDRTINRGPLTVDGDTARHAPIRKVNNDTPILHASVSCKWTLRSDRAQNARTEALNLIRNRKGRVPHIVAITGEPLPSRIASLALGTGDLDCVYHVALPELIAAVEASGHEDALTGLKDLMVGRRLRDIADLPLDLCV